MCKCCLAGIDTRLCCQVGYRDTLLVVKYARQSGCPALAKLCRQERLYPEIFDPCSIVQEMVKMAGMVTAPHNLLNLVSIETSFNIHVTLLGRILCHSAFALSLEYTEWNPPYVSQSPQGIVSMH